MLNLYSTDNLDVQRYYQLLCEKGFIYVDLEQVRDDVTFLESRVSSLAMVTIKHMQITQRKSTFVLSDDSVYDYLVDGCDVSHSALRAKNVRGWSVDNTKLSRLADRKKVADFLDLYQAYQSSKTKKGFLAGIMTRAMDSEEFGRDGVRLGKVPFIVEPRQNLRFYYKKESIIQIPKSMSSCVTVPREYFLAWGDFASADMIAALNCYLIDTERDREIAAMHGRDGYAIFAHLISEFYEEEFDKEEFLKNRAAYKLYALKTIYGNTYGATEEEAQFIKRAIPYLQSKSRYTRYMQNITNAYEIGLPIEIESYFGTKQILDRTPENSSLTEVLDKALNTPIQTHTSERVIWLVLSIVDAFLEQGYRYGDDFWVYFIRHDEPLFIFRNEMQKDMWILADKGEIVVDDGITQFVDWIYGFNYTVPNADLQESIEKVYKENKHRMHPAVPKHRVEEYLPVRDMLATGVYMRSLGDDLVVTIYVENDNTVAYKKYAGMANASQSEKLDILQDIYLNRFDKAKFPGLGNVLVYNDLTGDALYQDNVYFLMKKEYGKPWLKARSLGEWTCARVARRDNIAFESQQDFGEAAIKELRGSEHLMSSYKKSTYDILMEYYQNNGFEKTVETARKMLSSKTHKEDMLFLTHVHGEICEVVAMLTIDQFMQQHPEETKDWFVTKGTILRDPQNKGRKNYFTELDVTLFTPQMIYALECKCYSGEKKLQDECTINRRGNKTDVYAQHKRHIEVLINNIDTARQRKDVQGYQLILLIFGGKHD